jgi:hypothetical protein
MVAPSRVAHRADVGQATTQRSHAEHPAGSRVISPSGATDDSTRHAASCAAVGGAESATRASTVASGSHKRIGATAPPAAAGRSEATGPRADEPARSPGAWPITSAQNRSRSRPRLTQVLSSQPITFTPTPKLSICNNQPADTISSDGTFRGNQLPPTGTLACEASQTMATPHPEPPGDWRASATSAPAPASSQKRDNPFNDIAPERHALTQAPQPVQAVASTTTCSPS